MGRTLEIFIALILLIVLSPVMLCISIIVRIRLGPNVIFKQLRVGKLGKPFHIYKFRSMNERTNEFGALLPDEIRLTPLGMFLRTYSLDELPQLWNVIRGEISFIGPRPLLFEYMSMYSDRQARRHEIRPGITGWAQVNGRNLLSWEEKFEMDVWYVDNRTMKLDLFIIWLTIKNIIIPEGISRVGSATMEKFKGTEQMEVKR